MASSIDSLISRHIVTSQMSLEDEVPEQNVQEIEMSCMANVVRPSIDELKELFANINNSYEHTFSPGFADSTKINEIFVRIKVFTISDVKKVKSFLSRGGSFGEPWQKDSSSTLTCLNTAIKGLSNYKSYCKHALEHKITPEITKKIADSYDYLQEITELIIDDPSTNVDMMSCERFYLFCNETIQKTGLKAAITSLQETLAIKIVKRGAQVNLLCDGKSPLEDAFTYGQQQLADQLITKGADVFESSNSANATSMHRAASNLWPSTIVLLHEAAKKQVALLCAETLKFMPKEMMAFISEYEGAEYILTSKDHTGDTPLHYLVYRETKNADKIDRANSCAEILLQRGGSELCNISNNNQKLIDSTPFYNAVQKGDKELVKLMIQNGAQKNWIDLEGFKKHCIEVDPEIIKLLEKS